ncbi:sensor histidine kinase [Paenibacillus mendelii]|uniref:histidine kinase n=1 Tax=Paenibacillus mendelii TaxID=206163 RepID=A0ABV6J4X0_9BACL|nr:sensor histidine kinase [Paenibacillus mendelii]MCQ6560551.1 sensor histidine kinase [Paenibacillus mendelii]
MNWTHRKRIIAASIGLSLCTQIVLVAMGILGAERMDRDIDAQARAKLLDSASHNVATYFSQLASMLSFLQSGELADYVGSYLGFKDAEFVARQTDRANAVLGQIRLSDSLVDEIYILGNFSFQKSVVIRAGQDRMSEETAPSIDDLTSSNLLPILQYTRNRPVVFAAGELTGRLRSSPAMSPRQVEDIRKLAQALEGRVILNGGVFESNPRSFIVIMVLKENLLGSLVHADSYASFALTDHDGRSIGRTPLLAGDDVIQQEKTIDASGMKLAMYTQRRAETESNKERFLLNYLIFFLVVTIMTFVITFLYSHYLILPFRKLSHRMTKQHLLFPLQYLRKHDGGKHRLPPLSLRKKLVVLFFAAVCIPAVSSGFAYHQFLHAFAVQQMKPAVKQYADQVGLNIRRQAVIYEDLIRKLSLNQTFIQQLNNESLGSVSGSPQAPDISFLQYSGINDSSYFVLYNLLGTRIYSNQNSESFNYLSLDGPTRERIDRAGRAVWLSNGRDLYNQQTVSLVKAVFDNRAPASRTVGYIQIVFAQSAFQSSLPQDDVYTATLDAGGNQLFQNDAFRKMAAGEPSVWEGLVPDAQQYAEVNGVRGVALVNVDREWNWRTYFMESTDAVDAKQRALIFRYASVIIASVALAMLLAYGLSRWLLRSLEHLKLAMEHQIEEVKMDREIRYGGKGRDEIGELIDNYNRMLARINGLMEENIRIAEENSLSRMKQQELLSLNMQAELNMLQLQINPHFLYNTLQSIGMRSSGSGDEEASFMLYALADLFRYSIGQEGHYVTLAEEIRHTRNYIAIQEFRFKNKFTVEWNVSEAALQCRTIKFILQPLVENAITHGFLNSIRSGTVWIDASLSEGELLLTVRDNGMGIEAQRLDAITEQWERSRPADRETADAGGGTGIGLSNVFHRLRLLYDGASRMKIESEWFEGTAIRLTIPQTNPQNE